MAKKVMASNRFCLLSSLAIETFNSFMSASVSGTPIDLNAANTLVNPVRDRLPHLVLAIFTTEAIPHRVVDIGSF